ncbi:MAG: hypothetical protein LC667_08945 [Thioalkalivibrio sp.]|nr:hypothetical protein [Thioalkalivibrio sp.]
MTSKNGRTACAPKEIEILNRDSQHFALTRAAPSRERRNDLIPIGVAGHDRLDLRNGPRHDLSALHGWSFHDR